MVVFLHITSAFKFLSGNGMADVDRGVGEVNGIDVDHQVVLGFVQLVEAAQDATFFQRGLYEFFDALSTPITYSGRCAFLNFCTDRHIQTFNVSAILFLTAIS